MFPKVRLDALHDGIFSVAMTLLVLDVRLPEEFHPRDGAELLQAVANLWPKFLPYLLSFTVLGLRWLASIEIRSRVEYYNRAYVNLWLFYLLLITCVPFSTIVVGRYASLAPAVWLYAGHLLLIALVSMRMMALTPDLEHGPFADQADERDVTGIFRAADDCVELYRFADRNVGACPQFRPARDRQMGTAQDHSGLNPRRALADQKASSVGWQVIP